MESAASPPRDGSASRADNARPSQTKRSHKFNPFRKRQLREARSAEMITPAEMLPSMNEIVDSAHPSLNRTSSQPSISQAADKDLPMPEPTWTVHHYQGSKGSEHLTALPAPKMPPPVPVPTAPKRVSSKKANRDAIAYQNSKHTYGTNDRSKAMNSNAEDDDISLRLGTTSIDDPQWPRTPLSSVGQPTPGLDERSRGDSPVVGRNGDRGRQPSTQSIERPQARGRPSGGYSHMPPLSKQQSRQDSSIRHERSPAQHNKLSPGPPGSFYHILSTEGPKKIGPEVLAQLQTPSADKSDVLDTELNLADDPDSWDVINPNTRNEEDWDRDFYSLEKRAEQLYSPAHLRLILENPDFHYKFSTFLRKYRPWRLPILEYYWSTCKAIKALDYANSLAATISSKPRLETHRGVVEPPSIAANEQLHEAALAAFDELLRDDLHWYIANTYIGIVGSVMQSRIMGTLPAPLREASHGLAEVFCITDPTRRDNPIILASQAFTRHSGCNMDYILGRNCRFMQGPGTTVDSCRRFAISMKEERDHSGIFVNYRRDGSPFLSLVMNAQLVDSEGNIRYYLGAQVDISGLLKSCAGLDSLTKLVEEQQSQSIRKESIVESTSDEQQPIKSLSEMLSGAELDVIGKYGGLLQKGYEHELQQAGKRVPNGPQRVLLADASDDSDQGEVFGAASTNGDVDEKVEEKSLPAEVSAPLPTPQEINLSGVYKYYLIVRPAPSLRVLFASPTLRTPGVLQSNFLHRIGGTRMRKDLGNAFTTAEVVTAKVRWLKNLSEDGAEGEATTRWIHCTPLMHHTGAIGLWMIVVVMPNEKKDLGNGSVTSSMRSERSSSRFAMGRAGEERVVRREDRPKPRYVQQR